MFAKNNYFIKEFLKLKYPILLFFFYLLFIFLKWSDLSLPIWHDEMSYAPSFLWHLEDWRFFLPWNYEPTRFMGHPFLHPFILWLAFSIFGPSVFVAKVTSLFLSTFFLLALYKMIQTVFKSSMTAFYSVLFVMFLPLFVIHSSLILADISAMAFGFASIYAFTAKKYKSSLIFSFCLGSIRETSLAFFLPIILYGLFVSSHRKLLFYLLPGFLFFISNFVVFFLKSGNWIAHPYIYEELPHNPNPDFLIFSAIFSNTKGYFFNLVLGVFPLSFLVLSVLAIVLYLFNLKKTRIFRKEFLIPLGMCFLWFSFWIMYPDQLERNYFPVLMFLVPIGIYFIIASIPFHQLFLIFISGFLCFNAVYLKSYTKIKQDYYRHDILTAKNFISYFENKYGDKIRSHEKTIYSIWPLSEFMLFPEYEYIQTPIKASLNCELNQLKNYKAIIFRQGKVWENCLPFYFFVKSNPLFIKIDTPFKDYEVFFHKDLLKNLNKSRIRKNVILI